MPDDDRCSFGPSSLHQNEQETRDPEIIRPDSLYATEGVIIPDNYPVPFTHVQNQSQGRFTPTVDQILLTERLFFDRYNDVLKDNPSNLGFEGYENVRRSFRSWVRQYYGWVNQDEEKIVGVMLLNFEDVEKAKEAFCGWRHGVKFGFGRFYERNQRSVSVNLNERRLSIP